MKPSNSSGAPRMTGAAGASPAWKPLSSSGWSTLITSTGSTAAAIAVTTTPPSECPIRCGRSSPSRSVSSAMSSASVPTSNGGTLADCPWPRRSTATTSNRSASAGISGSQLCLLSVMPCTSTSGGPDPVRW